MLFETTDANFDEKVLQNSKPVLVDFWAPSCKPCLSMGPIFEKLAEQLDDKIDIAKINVDDNNGVAKTYNVRGLPLVMLFDNGKTVDKKLGAMSEQQIKQWVIGKLAG